MIIPMENIKKNPNHQMMIHDGFSTSMLVIVGLQKGNITSIKDQAEYSQVICPTSAD